jgi:hypothetical protein
LSGARSFRRQTKALYPEPRHVVSLSGSTRATAPTIVRGRHKPAYCARAEPPAQTSEIVLNAAADATNAAETEDSPYCLADRPRALPQLQAKGLRPSFQLSDFGFHNRLVASSNGEVEGPPRSARLEPRVHNFFQHPRRHYRRSRTPPTIVRSHPHRLPLCACGTTAASEDDIVSR